MTPQDQLAADLERALEGMTGGPTAAGIVALRNGVPALLAERRELVAEEARLRAAGRAFLDTISAAEALGWDWWSGMKRVKALHPISGDLSSSHAKFAAALTEAKP